MIPTYFEEERYRTQAVYFAGAAILLGCVASVHLEDSEDEVFWKAILEKNSTNKKFNFLYYSQSVRGNDTRGVHQCLKYKPFLSNRFFICIDSDYRYLMQETDINSNHFIFQTYTYSFENHLCYLGNLNLVCEKATGLKNSIFDFEQLLLSYSNTVYEAFIWHLYFVKNDESKFLKSEFTQLINLREFDDINDNGKVVIDILKQRCNVVTAKLKVENTLVNIEEEKNYYFSLGLKPDNAYLFVRGHNLYDLICAIGNAVDETLLYKEKERLNEDKQAIKKLYARKVSFEIALLQHIMFDAYSEIKRIGTEIQSLFSKSN